MMLDVILSIATLWTLRKGLMELKYVKDFLKKLTKAELLDVSEVYEKAKNMSVNQKIFVIVKGISSLILGLLRSKDSKSNNSEILKFIETKELREHSHLERLKKKNWDNLVTSFDFRMPKKIENLNFLIEDERTKQIIEVKDLAKTNLTGALNEISYRKDINLPPSNSIASSLYAVYNMFASQFPFNLFLKTTLLGNETSQYGIVDRQYSVVIGEIIKEESNKIMFKEPEFVTKQKGYILEKVMRKKNNILAILIILCMISTFLAYKFVRSLFKRYRKTILVVANEVNEEERSQNEGDQSTCIVCMDKTRCVIFKPCKHYGLCQQCYLQLKSPFCPYCKKEITGIIQVFKKK